MQVNWPEWWQWQIEFTDHVMERMVQRGFNEVDLRTMLSNAEDYSPNPEPERYDLATRLTGRHWKVVVEPLPTLRVLLVITAYPVE